MLLHELKGKRVAFLASGGLDSTTIISWLSENGVRVVAVTVDLGQPEEKDMNDILQRMKAAGAEEAILIDGKYQLTMYGYLLVQGLGAYEGRYLNTTGIARMAAMKVAVPKITKMGIGIIAHGATGRGNDQVRFELAAAHLNPDLLVYAPWRDPEFLNRFGGRKEMIQYCQSKGLKVSATIDKPYSTDSNMLGLTHEAGELESLKTPTAFVDFQMGVRPEEAPDKPEVVKINFQDGLPCDINNLLQDDEHFSGKVFELLNEIGGRNGIGIGLDVVENRQIGIKSRGVYEAPALSILFFAYDKLLELFLDRDRRRFFDQVSSQLGEAVYYGKWFGPYCSDLLAVVANIAKNVFGEVTISLYKGNISLVSRSCFGKASLLYDAEASSMEKTVGINHVDSTGFINMAVHLAKIQARAGMVNSTL